MAAPLLTYRFFNMYTRQLESRLNNIQAIQKQMENVSKSDLEPGAKQAVLTSLTTELERLDGKGKNSQKNLE